MSNEVEFIPEDPSDAEQPVDAQPGQVTQDPPQVIETPVQEETPATFNGVQSSSIDIPPNEVNPANSTYKLSFPSVDLLEFTAKLRKFNALNIENPTAEQKQWRKVTEDSVDYYTVGGLYQDRFMDPTSEFHQGVQTKEGGLNTISSLKFKKTEGELKGEIALLKVSKMLGLGDVINIPLPHSGIWVTIKPPSEKDLIDFYNSVFREKVMMGRGTYGLTLSNFSVHINNRLYDFIQKHIHSVNFGDIPKDELKNYILIHDFHVLAWGFACTMYPTGFDYQRACTYDIEQCTHVTHATLNLTKLLWVDNKSLTEAQKVILSENRPNKLSIESYRKFVAEHTRVTGSSFTTKQGLKFKLKVPTIAEYIADGLGWVNKINAGVEAVILTEGDDQEAKNELLNQYVKSSILRQFNHFVDFIEVEDNVISDRDTINQTLEVLSADDDLRQEITENILKFKAATTLALIGVPDYKCPSCGKSQNPHPHDERFTSVIPIDTMNAFFTMLTYRISKILEREV